MGARRLRPIFAGYVAVLSYLSSIASCRKTPALCGFSFEKRKGIPIVGRPYGSFMSNL